MIVHHITAATLCPLSTRLVNGSGGLLSRGHLVCHCWLVESSDGLVLVDTGVGQDDLTDVPGRMGRWFEVMVHPERDLANTALAQVARLGFDPRDVRHIIPTHLDLDHAGGLPDFPWATVHVSRPEYETAIRPATRKDRQRYRPMHWAHGPRWDVREPDGEPWFGFDGVRALDERDDLLLVPLPGHTRGHCGIAVKTATGWLLHAGDAYFHHREMEREPSCTPGLALFQRLAVTDNRQRLDNQRRLRALALDASAGVTIHSAHCPVELERLVAATATREEAACRPS